MPNQYIDAEGNPRPNPPPSQNAYTLGKRDRMDPEQKAKIRAAFASDKLIMYLKGEVELTPAQVSAAKALMDKGMPSMQSIESKTVNEIDTMDEEGLKSMVRALILSHPELIKEFAPGAVAVPQSQPSAVQQPEIDAPKAA